MNLREQFGLSPKEPEYSKMDIIKYYAVKALIFSLKNFFEACKGIAIIFLAIFLSEFRK